MLSGTTLLRYSLLVFVGGVLGGFARWCFTNVIHHPLAATLTSNVTVSAVIGFAVGLPGQWQTFLGAGFAGALSTLAMLARQLGTLVQRHEYGAAIVYGVGSALLALAAAAIGMQWARIGFGLGG